MIKSYGFPVAHRLKKPAEFEAVYKDAVRTGDGLMLGFARGNGLDRSRIGLSVSRKYGNAVQRNRIKRLLREAFRLSQPLLPKGLDLVLIPRKGIDPGLDELSRSLVRIAGKLERKVLLRSRSANIDGSETS